jgi:hypothetical protein
MAVRRWPGRLAAGDHICGPRGTREESPDMPAPARRVAPRRAAPPPTPVEHAVRVQRAKRRARVEHERERRLARRRFAGLMAALLLFTAFLGLTIWQEIQSLFGL